MMTKNKQHKTLIAIALSGLLAGTSVAAETLSQNGSDNGNNGAKPSLKERSNGPATSFIVKLKDGSQVVQQMQQQSAEHPSSNAAAVAQQMRGFTSVLSKRTGKSVAFERSMALQQHFVVKAQGRLSPEETKEYLQSLKADSDVEFVEENKILRHFATPNDPNYDDQWHYYESVGGLNAPTAWDSVDGSGVVVAVLDTGYRPHSDLAGNILPGYDMISDSFIANDGDGRDSDAQDPGDWVSAGACGNGYPAQDQDSSWHGTHVAGTIAAETNNSTGVAGVAYGAKIVPVRVLGRCGGTTADIADGIVWASGGSVPGTSPNANPADVLNMSLGGSGTCSTTTQNAINTARNNGATVVVASGNSNDNSTNYNPGNCNGVVNVASTDRNGDRAYYSNYGSNVDVAAPGGAMQSANDPNGVLSTYNTGTSTPGSDSYGYSQGTSMAAPHVAGAAALIKAADPAATPDDIEQILRNSARSFPGSCNGCGTGIVDAAAAVALASGGGNGGDNGGDDGGDDGSSGGGGTVDDLSASTNEWNRFYLDVPAGMSTLTVTITGDSGDADLYLRQGSQPTQSNWDCRPYNAGNEEVCTIDNPQEGRWHIGVFAYSAYSGVDLEARYEP